MSIAEVTKPQETSGAGGGNLLLKWLPPIVLILAIIGIVLVVPMTAGDSDARTWYRDTVGGSELYRLNVIFGRLVPLLAGAFIAIALMQRQHLKAREVHSAESLQRHGWTEVLTHWLNAAGIVICIVTAAMLLGWFGDLSLNTLLMLHFIGAGFVVAAVAHHVTYQLVDGGRGLLRWGKREPMNALAEAVSYAGVYRGVPGAFGVQLPQNARRRVQPLLRRFNIVPDYAGKYLATEKVISYTGWAVLVGVVVVTGLIKSLHYVYGMPGWLRQWSSFLHDGAVYFFIAMLIVHVAALTLVPRNWRLLLSMFTTRVPRKYAEEHLPLWAEEAKPE
ncbi:MAG TPA: cytochrome b/b6 domain-containing protein [Dehalococcoidia bacterium]